MEIYRIEKLHEDLYCIRETESVNIYVILGEEKALVLDTGYGYGDLIGEIRKITDKPLVAAVTHGDPDHAMGSFHFDQVYINPADLPDLIAFDHPQFKRLTLDYRLHKMPQLKGKINEEAFMATSLAEVQFLPLQENDVLDLGGLSLEVIAIPGHSQGSVALYESQRQWLFTGDTITAYNIWNHSTFPQHCSPLSVLMASYKKIAAMRDQIQEIYPAHGEKPLGTEIIDSDMACVRDLCRNYADDALIETFVGPAYRHQYQDRILLYSKPMLEEALKNGVEE